MLRNVEKRDEFKGCHMMPSKISNTIGSGLMKDGSDWKAIVSGRGWRRPFLRANVRKHGRAPSQPCVKQQSFGNFHVLTEQARVSSAGADGTAAQQLNTRSESL